MLGDHLWEEREGYTILWSSRGCCHVDVQVWARIDGDAEKELVLVDQVRLIGDVENTAEVHRSKIMEEACKR